MTIHKGMGAMATLTITTRLSILMITFMEES
jgi:hypothetical protein